jgi:hypothetical protein
VTPEAQKIAIAEACGWIWHGDASWTKDPNNFYWKKDHLNYRTLPDYLNDLNAMHEAEKVLNEKQDHIMNDTLWDMCEGRKYLWHATASQRAEAFLRTIGKWQEAKP